MEEPRPNRAPSVAPGGVELFPRDMTAMASAAVTLQGLQERLAGHAQYLPVDGDPAATLGMLVEQNSTGPLRLGYGAWRDLLLGVQFENGRGELITAGGRPVKNVAGYDLTKFMVGQRGVFGRIVTITTRTYRLPAGAVHARFAAADTAIVERLLVTCRPQWCLMRPGELLCGYHGDETTLGYYERAAASFAPTSVRRATLAEDESLRAEWWRTGAEWTQVSVGPGRLMPLTKSITDWVGDPVFGIVRVRGDIPVDVLKEHRATAYRSDGAVVVTTPQERELLERLKRAFDPEHVLAPLPGVAP
jgi:hypothetical protein